MNRAFRWSCAATACVAALGLYGCDDQGLTLMDRSSGVGIRNNSNELLFVESRAERNSTDGRQEYAKSGGGAVFTWPECRARWIVLWVVDGDPETFSRNADPFYEALLMLCEKDELRVDENLRVTVICGDESQAVRPDDC